MNPIVNPIHPVVPLKFHANHSGVEISGDGQMATWRTRIRGQKKYAFSDRPIRKNEKVFVRVMENSILNEAQPDNQKNRAHFGFSCFDPAKLSTAAGQLELHSDVKASLITENLKKGAIYSFWMNDEGLLKCGSDCQVQQQQQHQQLMLESGDGQQVIPTHDSPFWFVVRSRGNITLKLVESDIVYMVAGNIGPGKEPCTIVYPDLANAFAHIMQVNNYKSNNAITDTKNSDNKTNHSKGD